ncbi:MAG: type II toxin-antitoxin system Phd/YefM family antitoxin [Atopobiaceae bacterium]|jgi:PHD/YefM family antitoxin component YafN of YafNO toxin-antitoxin module|nr:type II toxin-antitoxin system Phd/YefM family antitoxin [Atopobiaceae bacterium]
MPVTIPVRDLKDTAKVCELCQESEEPIIVTRNGYEVMVLVKPDDYHRMHRDSRKQELYDAIAYAEAQCDRGECSNMIEDLKRMWAEYGL